MDSHATGGGLMDEFQLMKDQKYRVYMANVDKALKNFEYSSEWADLISALGKLNKVISNYPKYQIIPRRIKISKRLAQCMHPALPSGVHLKALESYDVIFQNTGTEMLAAELFIYSAGLFPLLRYAAMNVRPTLLGIYEKYFVPLGDRLRPALSGFLSGVLPGYEAGLDHFDQTNSLLEQVSRAVGEVCFYTCLWECVATNASIRLPAVSYILDHFKKRQTLEQQKFFLGRNHDIMMSGLCGCLNDSLILVQRNALEFLLTAFPMHSAYSLKEQDLIRLVTNALNTILRRDMSLNRRLYSWLLGSEVASAANRRGETSTDGNESQEEGGGGGGGTGAGGVGGGGTVVIVTRESYFERHSKRILIRALKLMLKLSLNCEPIDLRPYKILVSLLDKLEIGPQVLDFVLFDVVRTMAVSMSFQGGSMPLPMANWSSDVNKSAQLLFATFDPAYIWNFMTSQYERGAKTAKYLFHKSRTKGGNHPNSRRRADLANGGKVKVEVDSGLPTLVEVCYLTEFLLETISLEMYNETTRIFLPKVFLAVTQMLTQYSEHLCHEDVIASLKLCLKIVARVQPMITSPAKRSNKVASLQSLAKENLTCRQDLTTSLGNCLEKSKSDSRINNRSAENRLSTATGDRDSALSMVMDNDTDLPADQDDAIKRSVSQNVIASGKKSPKKSTKKSKSYSKLGEVDASHTAEALNSCSPTGQLSVVAKSGGVVSELKLMKRLKKSPMARLKNRKSNSHKEEVLVVEVTEEGSTTDLHEISVSTTTGGGVDGEDGYEDGDEEDTSLESDILPVTSLQEYSILEQCIRQYETFYHVFVSRQIFNLLEGTRLAVSEEGEGGESATAGDAGESVLDEYLPGSLYELRDHVVVDSAKENQQRMHQIDGIFETLLVARPQSQRELNRLLEESILVSGELKIVESSSVGENNNLHSSRRRRSKDAAEQEEVEQEGKTDPKLVRRLMELKLYETLRNALKLASNLLVELSTFPNYNQQTSALDEEHGPAWSSSSAESLPQWLRVLAIVSCYLRNDKEIQINCISTLFELVSLLQAQYEPHTLANLPGVTYVVMLPLLRVAHIRAMEKETRVFQLLTSVLWDFLADDTVDRFQVTSLLYQLHASLERSGTVETVIGHRLTNSHVHWQFECERTEDDDDDDEEDENDDDSDCDHWERGRRTRMKKREASGRLDRYSGRRMENVKMLCPVPVPSMLTCNDYLDESETAAFRKFELLWHLGRDRMTRGFDKILMQMFDHLTLPNYAAIRSFVTKWLQESLLRGDLSRLVQPLLSFVLAPNTKRIGVVHAHLLRQSEKEAATADIWYNPDAARHGRRSMPDLDADDLNIIAVSTENGNNVAYQRLTATAAANSTATSNQNNNNIKIKKNNNNKLHDRPTAMNVMATATADGGSCGGGGGFNSSLIASKQKRSPIRTIQKKIFGVSLNSGGNGGGGGYGSSAGGVSKSNNNNNNSMSTANNNNNISVIINPMETNNAEGESPVTSVRIKLHAHGEHEEARSENGGKVVEESETTEPKILSTSAPTGAVNFLVTGVENEERQEKQQREEEGYDDDDEMDVEDEAEDEADQEEDEEDEGDEDEPSVDKDVDEAADMSLLETNNSDEDESSWQQSHHQRNSHHNIPGIAGLEDGRSSCDSMKICSEGEIATASGGSSHRFVGDVNFIGDVMSEHDRTKNKKNYSLQEGMKMKAAAASAVAAQVRQKGVVKEAKKAEKKAKKQRLSGTSKGSSDSGDSKSGKSMSYRFSDPVMSAGQRDELAEGMDELLLRNNINWEKSKRNVEILRENNKRKLKFFDKIHPLHSHMLLYYGVYDTKRVLHCLRTLRNLLANEPRTFLCLTMTTSVADSNVKGLLIRHRKSVFGKGFDGVIQNTEFSHAYRGCMYLESLITICLYYMRSYFARDVTPPSTATGTPPSNGGQSQQSPTAEDIRENGKVQLASVELLTAICNEMVTIAKEMGKGFVSYIADLIAKCKLQKIVLHSVLTSVYSFGGRDDVTLTDEVLRFNDPGDDRLHYESLQIVLLKLLQAVIRLEFEVSGAGDFTTNGNGNTSHNDTNSTSSSHSPTRAAPNTPTNIKYLNNCNICQQPMFLSAILNALQADHLRHLHKNWTDIIVASLGCFGGGSLTNIVISVVHQICNNLDKITMLRAIKETKLPPDYTLTQVEALTVLVHYCLLDSTQQMTLSHVFNQAGGPNSAAAVSSVSTNQLLNNLVHVFLSTPLLQLGDQQDKSRSAVAMHMAARNAMLSHLPRIVASVAALWDNEIGQGRLVNKQLLELLSPISLHHNVNFLAAIAVVWQERGDLYRRQQQHQVCVVGGMTSEMNGMMRNEQEGLQSGEKSPNSPNYRLLKPLPQACNEQVSLVKLISGIRILPMDSFVQTLQQVVKQPPAIHHPPPGLSLDVSALELFYFYMQSVGESQLNDAWPSLLAMLRDGLTLSAPGQFVLLAILSDFVQRSPQMPFADKRDLRDLHDITSKLVESISAIGASCLEQTTWLRRNLAVKEEQQHQQNEGQGGQVQVGGRGALKDSLLMGGNQQYAVQAQSVLAVLLANVLDITYGSQEKDKVVTLVTTLMYNITPYLKNHTVRNIPSFLACSSLLASLSMYQYTRKAWRKDVLDLLLEPSFFQMDISCLPYWKSILDSLMTCDNTTFRELMNRVSMSQTGSLNIFASKEMEYEQRAALLKRLAFIIFCSEFDQYHKYMPEIQEQLANSLRLPQVVPSVQASVLLCFRVLLLRMSPDHVTSLWPIIIAEMVQVLLSVEQELKVDSEEFREHIKVLSGLNSQWVTHSSNGLHSNGHPQWRMVQLETAKLLELGCVLPATNLPHFQMYRWAFVGGVNDDYLPEAASAAAAEMVNGCTGAVATHSVFVPHVTRIARLMDLRFTTHSPRTESARRGHHLSLTCQSIQGLQDLYGFFSTLSIAWPPYQFSEVEKEVKNCLAEIESVLALDFLEKMPQSVTSLSSHSLVTSHSNSSNGLAGSSSMGSIQSQQSHSQTGSA